MPNFTIPILLILATGFLKSLLRTVLQDEISRDYYVNIGVCPPPAPPGG